MKDIESKFGKTVLHDKFFIGGGEDKLLKDIKNKVRNNIEISGEMKWYSNCQGYLFSLTK